MCYKTIYINKVKFILYYIIKMQYFYKYVHIKNLTPIYNTRLLKFLRFLLPEAPSR